MTLITIVTPCYNHARYLPEAVESVVAQTHTDWEMIIVDDGSSDGTAEIAQQLIARFPQRRIELLRQANQGLPASRNNAIALARGAYIFPLDADDIIEPDMLSITSTVLDQRPDVGFVYTNTRLFGNQSGILENRRFDAALLRIDCFLHSQSLFRRAAWEQSGYCAPMVRGHEDWDFWLGLVEHGWSGFHVPLPLLRYRRSDSSKLDKGRRYDLELRAQVILNHTSLYEPPFQRWARAVRSHAWSRDEMLRSPGHWLLAYAWYNLLIARYAPRELPRMLLRPFYWRLPPRLQNGARRLARSILRG
jgi:glycosyltransferase involved in cell wall biosynthesis